MNPVCFASVAFSDPTGPVCSGCSLAVACHGGALQRLELLPDTVETRSARVRLESAGRAMAGQGRVGLQVSRRGVARRELTADESHRLRSLPARARSQARRLAERGWFDYARAQLAAGRMPAGIEGSKLAVALRRMLTGDCGRHDLVAAFVMSGNTPGAAQVEATTAASVLHYGRLATSYADRFVLNPNL